MGVEKNIIMNQFNGTDYDTLYPKTKVEQVEDAYSQQQILADSTKALYGLGNDAVPDDVFFVIALSKGKHIIRLTAVFSDGTPADDVLIQGIQPITGSEVRTNSKGIAVGYTDTDSTVVSVKDYIGIDDASVTASSTGKNDIVNVSMTLTKNNSLYTISESCTKYVHKSAIQLDLCTVGGGAAGGNGTGYDAQGYGSGGGGGYVNNVAITAISAIRSLLMQIGAGGATNGATGGATSVTRQDGAVLSQASGGGPGTTGNGTGGSGSRASPGSGGNSTTNIFNDASLGLAGGGGGGGGGYSVSGDGGNPYGGKGSYGVGASAGRGPGGGGGGGSASEDSGHRAGGSGYRGVIYARVRY